MVLASRDLGAERLERRKQLLEEKVVPRLSDPIRPSPELPGTLVTNYSPCPSYRRAVTSQTRPRGALNVTSKMRKPGEPAENV